MCVMALLATPSHPLTSRKRFLSLSFHGECTCVCNIYDLTHFLPSNWQLLLAYRVQSESALIVTSNELSMCPITSATTWMESRDSNESFWVEKTQNFMSMLKPTLAEAAWGLARLF